MMNLLADLELKYNGKKIKISLLNKLKRPKKIKNLEPKELSPKKSKTNLSSISSKMLNKEIKNPKKTTKKPWPKKKN